MPGTDTAVPAAFSVSDGGFVHDDGGAESVAVHDGGRVDLVSAYDGGADGVEGSDGSLAAWTAVLDALEADAASANPASAHPSPARTAGTAVGASPETAPWEPPANLGPLPAALAARAALVAGRLASAADILARAKDAVGRQIAAAKPASPAGSLTGAVYLDVNG